MSHRSRLNADYDPVTPSRVARSVENAAAGTTTATNRGVRPPHSGTVSAARTPNAQPRPAQSGKDNGGGGGSEPPSSSIIQQVEAVPMSTAPGKIEWILKRGHSISYAVLFLFTTVLYFRPYELFPALSSLTTIAYWLALTTLIVFVPSQFILEGKLTAVPTEVKLVLLFCLTALLSMPLAIDPSMSWESFNDTFIKAVLIFVITVNVVRTRPRLMGLLFLAMAVSVMLSLGALGDYRAGNFKVEGYRIRGMLGGMFGNPNDLALHLVTITPIPIALFFAARLNLFKKIIYISIAVLLVAGNMVTYSRGGFLALLAVGAVLAWKLGRGKRVRVTVFFLAGTFAFLTFMPGGYGERVGSIFTGGDELGSYSARRTLLKKSIRVTLANPLFGIGMSNFKILSAHNKAGHNAFTQVSAEMGIAAFVFYVMFIFVPLYRLRKIERESFDRPERAYFYYLSIGIQASLVAYIVGSFFASIAYQWYIYYLVAYAVCLRRIFEAKFGPVTNAAGQALEGDSAKENRGGRAAAPVLSPNAIR